MNHLLKSCLLAGLVLTPGCSMHGPYGSYYPISYRYVDGSVWVVANNAVKSGEAWAVTGEAPLDVAVVIAAAIGDMDTAKKHGWKRNELTPHRAVDFGDGSGWQDISALLPDMDFDGRDGWDVATMARHTYTEPGVYYILARATYWDGEVVSMEESTNPGPGRAMRVTVTEPQAAAP